MHAHLHIDIPRGDTMTNPPPPPGDPAQPADYGGAFPGTPQAPQQGYPAMGPPPPVRPKGLAVAALVVGIVAFLTGLVPVLGIVLGIGGVVLGILALLKRQSKGMGITGVVLGGIALLASLAMTIGFAAILGSSPPQSSSDAEKGTSQTPTPAASASSDHQPTQSERAGTAANPLPQPYVAEGLLGGEKYSLTARVVNASANEQVKAWNQFNSDAPAGYKYVIVEMTMTGIDPDGVEPSLAMFDLSLATAEGNRYDAEFIVFGEGMTSMSNGPTLYPGSSFTGFSAFIVPDAAASFLLYDNSNYIALE